MSTQIKERYEEICNWYRGHLDELARVRPGDAAMYRVELHRVRSAKPSSMQEVEQRTAAMAHALSNWGEMMMPREKLLEEIEAILNPAPVSE